MAMAEFIYVMTNKAFPNLVKIGISSKDPRDDRATELYQTGVPHPFRVEYWAFVEGGAVIEREVHKRFTNKRPNPLREFFEVDVIAAISTIREVTRLHGAMKFEETYYISTEEEKLLEKRKRADEAKIREYNEVIKLQKERRQREEEAKIREYNEVTKPQKERKQREEEERIRLQNEKREEEERKKRTEGLTNFLIHFFIYLGAMIALAASISYLPTYLLVIFSGLLVWYGAKKLF